MKLAIRDNQTHLTIMGRVRRFWHRLSGYDGELCQLCGGKYDATLWWADDELWRSVMPYDLGLACPSCFAALAEQRGFQLEWRPRVFQVRERGQWLTPHPNALARHFGKEAS